MVVTVVLTMVSVLVLIVVMGMSVVVTVVIACITDTSSPLLNSTDVYTIVPVNKFPFADGRKKHFMQSETQFLHAYKLIIPHIYRRLTLRHFHG
jgi:hypothetical protein